MMILFGFGAVFLTWALLSLVGAERHRRVMRLQAEREMSKSAPPEDDIPLVG